jgi:hypothetical protein
VASPTPPDQLPGSKNHPISRDFVSGSDGTRTRDLRRDRPAL